MSILEMLVKSTFHDGCIDHVLIENRNINLTITDCTYDRINFYTKIIEMKNVNSIRKFDIDIDINTFKINGQYGGVMTFELSSESALLLVEWEDFSPSRTEFAVYKFTFDSFSGTAMPAPPP